MTCYPSLLGFLGGAVYSLYKVRSHDHVGHSLQSQDIHKFCKICEAVIPGKDHHCVWIDTCISRDNMKYFLAFLACILMSLLQAGLIFLTSACLPLKELGPWILIPDRWCLRWNTHFEGDLHLTWTAGIHCFLLAAPIALLLIAKGWPVFLRVLKGHRL